MLRKSPSRTTYACAECGQSTAKWEGRCPACGAWNSINERPEPRPGNGSIHGLPGVTATELSRIEGPAAPRLISGVSEIDRVFGGGIVPGSVGLIAGDPGVGKSTLLLQLSDAIARGGMKVLYVCGEESIEQVRMRAGRLGVAGDGLFLLPVGQVETVAAELSGTSPAIVVIDSIQTMTASGIDAGAGSGSQVLACTKLLTEQAKGRGLPLLMTGHVTKEGMIAGPKLLEHSVDVVLYLEGDASGNLRLLRAVKNRFGPTDEVGVFEMRAAGMSEVADPSGAFLRSGRASPVPGSFLTTIIEGTRPFTVEVQALTSPSSLPSPRRLATGVDPARLALVAAVLTRRLGIALGTQDIIVNVPGGLRVREPAADLAIALALVSSLRDSPVHAALMAAAEVGLGGELRPAGQGARRAAEAARLGVDRCILAIGEEGATSAATAVATLAEAIEVAIPRR